MISRFHLLICALICSFSLLGCQKNSKPDLNDQPLPLLGQVPNFTLTNQSGEAFGSAQLQDAPYIAAFMFTRCPSICPHLTTTMKEIDEAMLNAQLKLQLVSISVDPDHDTPPRLREYAKKYHTDPRRWNFLTGNFQLIARTAEDGFKVGVSGAVDPQKPHLGITHASHVILVDKNANIRGYFRTSDKDVTDQLLSAVQRL